MKKSRNDSTKFNKDQQSHPNRFLHLNRKSQGLPRTIEGWQTSLLPPELSSWSWPNLFHQGVFGSSCVQKRETKKKNPSHKSTKLAWVESWSIQRGGLARGCRLGQNHQHERTDSLLLQVGQYVFVCKCSFPLHNNWYPKLSSGQVIRAAINEYFH